MAIWMRAEGTIGHATYVELLLASPEKLASQRGPDPRGHSCAGHRGNSQLKSAGCRRCDRDTCRVGGAKGRLAPRVTLKPHESDPLLARQHHLEPEQCRLLSVLGKCANSKQSLRFFPARNTAVPSQECLLPSSHRRRVQAGRRRAAAPREPALGVR